MTAKRTPIYTFDHPLPLDLMLDSMSFAGDDDLAYDDALDMQAVPETGRRVGPRLEGVA